MRISDHWAWSQGLMATGCVFFGEEGSQSKVTDQGIISSWNKGEMEVRE